MNNQTTNFVCTQTKRTKRIKLYDLIRTTNMATQGAVTPAAAIAEAPQQAGFWKTLYQAGFRVLTFYLIYNFVFSQRSAPPTNNNDKGLPARSGPSRNMFAYGEVLQLDVYLSKETLFAEFSSPTAHIWSETDIVYGDWEVNRQKHLKLPLNEELKHNGSLYLHAYLSKEGVSPDILNDNYRQDGFVYARKLLTKYMPPRKPKQLKKLLKDENEQSLEENTELSREWISFWHPNVTLSVLTDETSYPNGKMPEPVQKKLILDVSTGNYFPYFYANDFWHLKEDYMPINETLQEVDLYLEFVPISLFRWQIYDQLEQSLSLQASYGLSDSESDEFRHMLLHTNPWLLGLTIFVSMLHSLFDFLAFKNDIQFWQKSKSMEGLSIRTIFTNIFFQAVIFLYLVDNDTSYLILFSSGIGLAIEIWKVTKALNIKVDYSSGFPKVTVKERTSYTSKTKEYDAEAFRYLSVVVFPLFIGYTIYSLMYETHKSWYSFVLNTLVGFVYIFGFIMMTPQLFINYKLKSVAHMPWKSFMYKALNTFVDDLFSFIIRMPTMHRLACFRDDVIFFIYLYQRWVYPIDNKRVNEFGQVGEIDDSEPAHGEQQAITEATQSHEASTSEVSLAEKKDQ